MCYLDISKHLSQNQHVCAWGVDGSTYVIFILVFCKGSPPHPKTTAKNKHLPSF